MSIDTTDLVANIYADGQVTGGTTVTEDTWQQYTYTFQATNANTPIGFMFRQDPSGWSFDDASVTAANSSVNLLADAGFEDGTVPTNSSQPVGWSLIGTQGLDAGGAPYQGGAHTGSWAWEDGSVEGFDGIAQSISTTIGANYTLSFWLEPDELVGNEAPTVLPDDSSEVTEFLAYAGALPGGLSITPPPSQAPDAPIVATVDGSAPTSDVNNMPIIAGTASSGTPSGSTVTVYVDGAQVGTTTTTDDAGDWTFTPSAALAVGSHAITATETTNGGTSDLSSSYSLDIVTVPTITGVDGVGNQLDSNNLPAIAGVAAASTPVGTTITIYDGETALGTTTTTDAAGEWAFTPSSSLADGSHSLWATETVDSVTSDPSSAYLVTIDSVAPVVTGAVPSSNNGTLTVGQPITITLGTSEAVTVSGIPTLLLNSGGTATYDAAASTPTSLVFDYTVSAGEDAAELTISSINLNGGAITDDAGNAADLDSAADRQVGSVEVNTGFNPFASLSVSNPDPTAIMTVTAAVSSATTGLWGNLSDGSIGSDGVTYTVTGTAAQINAALAGVLLDPANGASTVDALTATVSDADPTRPGQLTDASSASSTYIASTPGEKLQGGQGSDTLIGMATDIVIHAGSGLTTVISAADGTTLIGLGDGPAMVNAQGADTIVGGSGTAVISAAADSFIGLNDGNATVTAGQGSLVIGGSGNDFVLASGSGLLLFAGAGETTFIGGTGSSTVVGGSGQSTIFGGAGGGLFAGGTGGDNMIVGGTQATTIFGGGNGDALFAAGSGGTMIAAGSGNETLQGSGSSGQDVFFGGSGSDLIGLGSGNDVVFAGTGSSTVVAGQGHDIFAFADGRAGGSETIIGFKVGTDELSVQGYADGEIGHDLASAATSKDSTSGVVSTTLTLSDNTKITLTGIGNVNSTMF